MRLKKRPGLILVLTALMVTVCRCQWEEPVMYTMNFTDGSSAQCNQFHEYLVSLDNFSGEAYSYDCAITCPDGTVVTPKLEGKQNHEAILNGEPFELGAFCTGVPISTPTEVPPPDETALPTEPPADSATDSPLLTEDVTACDLYSRFINFTLVQPSPDLTDKLLRVTLNDESANCSIPDVNPDILTCNVPNGVTFPAQVVVTVDDIEINNFLYDGSLCTNAAPTSSKPSNDDEPEELPEPTPVD